MIEEVTHFVLLVNPNHTILVSKTAIELKAEVFTDRPD